MSTPASLVAFPIGLWVFSVVADLFFQFGRGRAVWQDVAFYTLGGGLVGALLAAIHGFIDVLSITDAKARRAGLIQTIGNLVALVLFGASFWLRWTDTVGFLPAAFSIFGLVALGIASWFGGELVFAQSMGVKTPRNAPRSSSSVRRVA
jgi:uncharacterized membrane protein